MKNIFLAVMLILPTLNFAEQRATGGGVVEVLDIVVTNRMSRGKLDACEITYLLAFQDHIYLNGGLMAIRGSLQFAGFVSAKDKPPAVLLNVTGFDVKSNNPVLAPIDFAYLSFGNRSLAGSEFGMGPAEDGGLLVGYSALENPELALQLAENVNINFTRQGGASDVTVPLSVLAHDPNKAVQYYNCSEALLGALMNKFQ